jgi:PmbA protein
MNENNNKITPVGNVSAADIGERGAVSYDLFKEKLFKQAKEYGFTDYELYYSSSDSFHVEIFNGEISKYENNDEMGASFRGTYNGRVGYAYTEKLVEEVIPSLVKNAAGNAGIIEEKEIEKLYPGDDFYPEGKGYNPDMAKVTAAEKIEAGLAMEKYAFTLDPRVKGIDYCIVGSQDGMTSIANSYGLDLSNRANLVIAYLLARAEENGVTKTGFEFWVGNDFSQFDYKALADKTVKTAVSALGASSVPSGEYAIVFDNDAARSLFAAYSGIFFAENAQKGFSMLKDKVGTEIAAAGITLQDDGICDASIISTPFDSEGVATRNKSVIENGMLKTLLYNTKSAEKDGVKSTGNGFKPSFRAAVGTSVTNFYLKPSEKTREQIISEMGAGILITDLAGLHSGTNTISGDFSLSADGFLIEGGKIGRPVEQITVAGNFYDMLKNITDVGSDLRFGPPSGSGAVGMPSFLAKGLRISGL